MTTENFFRVSGLVFIVVFSILTILLWSPYSGYILYALLTIQPFLLPLLFLLSLFFFLQRYKIPFSVWVLMGCSVISVIACVVFYQLHLHESNFDALSRMNIARKVTDNLTPGLGQFGAVWPFLPQLLMVPFTAITPLWQSGIAGMIVSAPAFILSGLLIYLILYTMTKSKVAGIFGALLFSTNINLLLLQTMAMSESLFIFFILLTMYCLLRWLTNPTKLLLPLIFAAASVACASLVRYEGIAFALATILIVFVIMVVKKYPFKTVEGVTILFATLALFGVFLWCLYNATIFGDPFNWAKIYSGQKAVIATEKPDIPTTKPQTSNTLHKTFLIKSASYGIAIADMAGIPIFLLGGIGLIFYISSSRPFKDQKPLIVLLPLSIVFFVLFTFYKGRTDIITPPLNLATVGNFKSTFLTEANIRYGILLWPLVVIMVAWLMSRNTVLKVLAIGVLGIHIFTPLYHSAFLIYQLPLVWGRGSALYEKEDKGRDFLKAHYTGGLILISALKHDAIMFQLGLPYKTYIHEGTGKYWVTSRIHPQVYAQWIYMADPKDIRGGVAGGEEDPVTKNLEYTKTLQQNYKERYNDGIIDIFERRQKPLP